MNIYCVFGDYFITKTSCIPCDEKLGFEFVSLGMQDELFFIPLKPQL